MIYEKIIELKKQFPDVDLRLVVDFNANANGKNFPYLIALDAIIVPKASRSRGIGSEVVNQLKKIADEINAIIMLSPDDSFGATSYARLIRFYKRLGFTQNIRKTAIYTLPNYGMYRLPQIKIGGSI